MFRKRWLQGIVLFGICTLMIVGVAAQSEAKSKFTLNAVSAWPKNAFMVGNFIWFMDHANELAAKQYPGEFEIVYKGGPEVIPTKEQVDAMRDGLVDMVFTAASYYTSIIPAMDGITMSEFKPWEEREKGVNDFLQPIHKERCNAFYLSRMGSGFNFQIYSNKMIEKLDDFKGMRIRCSPTNIPFLKALGANPVVMGPGDLFTALERGVVDGYVWPQAHIKDWGWEAVTKYIIEPPTAYDAADITLVNLDKWNKLPKGIQELLVQAAIDAEHQLMERAAKFIPEETEVLKKAGLQVINLPDADAKQFVKITRDTLWQTLFERDPETSKKLKEMITK